MPQQRSLTRKTIREVSDNEDFGEEQQYFDESTDLAGFSALLQEEHTALDAADDAPALEDAPSSPMDEGAHEQEPRALTLTQALQELGSESSSEARSEEDQIEHFSEGSAISSFSVGP